MTSPAARPAPPRPRAARPARPPAPVPTPAAALERPAALTVPLPGVTPRRGGSGALARLDTPGRIRLAMAAAVIASVLVGLIALGAGVAQSLRLGAAAERSGNVVGLLEAGSRLTEADATVTNAFLVGGLEPAQLRADYETALAEGSSRLAALAGDTVASTTGLTAAVGELATYAGLIEAARANNRQGFPVGAAYLNQAATTLSDKVLPEIDSAVRTNADRAARDLNSTGGSAAAAWLVLLPLLVLVAIQVWLSRTTKRTLNVPMLIGSALLGIAALAAVVVLGQSADQANRTRQGAYTATLALSQASSLAGQARADEAFTLIRRGSGGAFEDSYQESVAQARDQIVRADSAVGGVSLEQELLAWTEAHRQVREKDDAGDWDGAVALVTERGAGSPSDAYQAFVDAAKTRTDELAARTTQEFAQARRGALGIGIVTAVAALACAVLSWRGLSRRLEEYR